MIEVKGNLWSYPCDIRAITTNGTIKKNGDCVMGRGCALEATTRYPGIASLLGARIKAQGNVPHMLAEGLISFPVKHEWHEQADLKLIEQSAKIISAWADVEGWDSIVIPRPGCGNGRLRWAEVKPVLEPYFDHRFHIITF